MLPWWYRYGDFDDGGESTVEDERLDHLFPVVLCLYWHLIFTFLLSLLSRFNHCNVVYGGSGTALPSPVKAIFVLQWPLLRFWRCSWQVSGEPERRYRHR